MCKDALGNELAIGDKAAYAVASGRSSGDFRFGEIVAQGANNSKMSYEIRGTKRSVCAPHSFFVRVVTPC